MWERLDNRGLLPQTSDEGSLDKGRARSRPRDQRAVLTQCKTRNNEQNVDLYSPFIDRRSDLAHRFASFGDAKMELFDYIEVFLTRRHRSCQTTSCSEGLPSGFRSRFPSQRD